MTDFFSGYKGAVELDDTGGTLRDIQPYVESVEPSWELAIHETPTLGSLSVDKVPGQDDGNISIEGPYHTTLAGYVGAPATWRTKRTFKHGPEGDDTGMPYEQCETYIKSFKKTNSTGDAVKYSLELTKTGALSTGTYS